jgi:hypothetical protein
MIISYRTQPISSHKSTDSAWDIGDNEAQNGSRCTSCDFVEPALLVGKTSGIGVVAECFLEDIGELSVTIGGLIICSGRRCRIAARLVIFFALKVSSVRIWWE